MKGFALRNFRTFSKRTEFSLPPLTILVGPNSSGKSSLMKALILCKESCIQNDFTHLDFSGGFHDLGSFEEVISRDTDDKYLEFGFIFPAKFLHGKLGDQGPSSFGTSHGTDRKSAIFPYVSERDDSNGRILVGLKFNQNRHVSTYFEIDQGGGKFETLFEIMSPHPNAEEKEKVSPRVEYKRLKSSDLSHSKQPYVDTVGVYINGPIIIDLIDKSEIEGLVWEKNISMLGQELNQKYTVVFEQHRNQHLRFLGSDTESQYSPGGKFFEEMQALFPSDVINASNGVGVNRERHNFFREDMKLLSLDCIRYVRRFFGPSNLTNISRLRSGAKEVYTSESIPDSFAQVLRRASGKRFPEPGNDLHRELAEWLDSINVGPEIEVKSIGSSAYIIRIKDGENMVPITNVGYGISQFIPLILFLAYPAERQGHSHNTFFLEEPESNLHPDFQARVADLLMRDLDRSPRMIVETHSEYLVRRMQLLVARGEASPDDIAIYYLGSEPSAEDYIRRITIDEDGQLSEPFGPGFFDQATDLMMDLFKYGQKN